MRLPPTRFNLKPGAMKVFETADKIRLLRRMIEQVMWEWNAVKEGRWEELPDHGARKLALIEEMKSHDWTPGPEERDNPEILILESQIVDLEYQVKKMLENRINVVSTQIDELKRRHNVWQKAAAPYRQAVGISGSTFNGKS